MTKIVKRITPTQLRSDADNLSPTQHVYPADVLLAAADTVDDMADEIRRLRAALLPFAMQALTRWAKDAPDEALVQVTLADCRTAQKTMGDD